MERCLVCGNVFNQAGVCVRWDCPRPSGEPGHILQPLFKLDPHSLIEPLCPAHGCPPGQEGGLRGFGGRGTPSHVRLSPGGGGASLLALFWGEKSNAATRSNNPTSQSVALLKLLNASSRFSLWFSLTSFPLRICVCWNENCSFSVDFFPHVVSFERPSVFHSGPRKLSSANRCSLCTFPLDEGTHIA